MELYVRQVVALATGWLPLSPPGHAVCACSSLAVQCPKAAIMWDRQANGSMTPDSITVQSAQVVYWQVPDGRQWQQVSSPS